MLDNTTMAVLFEKAGPVPLGSKTIGGCEIALATIDIRDVINAGVKSTQT